MKVKELIEKLQMYEPELLVVTREMDESDFADLETDVGRVQSDSFRFRKSHQWSC